MYACLLYFHVRFVGGPPGSPLCSSCDCEDQGPGLRLNDREQVTIAMTMLKATRIYRELDSRRQASTRASELLGRIDSSLAGMDVYLAEIRRYFHHFTDHSLRHSERIIYYIGKLLSDDQLKRWTDSELYMFMAAALVHDIGMVVAEGEVRGLADDPAFVDERRRILEHLRFPLPDDWTLRGIERLVAAEYLRKQHGKRCEYALSTDNNTLRQLTGGRGDASKWIGRIAVGHTVDFTDLCDKLQYPQEVELDTDCANIQFLTICLRIGDLLDINTARADPILQDLSEPLSVLSQAHWNQYADVEMQNLAPGQTTTICGTCPSQAAERVLREWVGWLQTECEHGTLLMNSHKPQHKLAIGRIDYNVRPKTSAAGKPLYEFCNFRFNLDEERVFKTLFGERLYGRPDAAIRELVQNGVDATRARIAYDLSDEDDSWDQLPQHEKRRLVREHTKSHASEFPITVKYWVTEGADGREEAWLSLEDEGIGMSRECIERYLLKVGHSRWIEDTVVGHLGLGTIGEFGLGFLSTFMISDRTVVETQSCLPNEEGIRATIYNWNGYLATEPLDRGRPGTTVSMLLKPALAEALKGKLANAVSRWFPFLELPIIVKDCDGSLTILEVVNGEGVIEARDGVCFRFNQQGSIGFISQQPKALTQWPVAPVSQDGIAVVDMPPPMLEIPSQRVLREYGIRVNLVGDDRCPLDLSRNLVKGGADEFWNRLIPVIWQGVAQSAIKYKEARNAFASYIGQQFYDTRGKSVFVMINGIFQEFGLGELPRFASLQLVDAADRSFRRCDSHADVATVILPDPPREIIENALIADDETASFWQSRTRDYFDLDLPLLSDCVLSSYHNLVFERYPYVRHGSENLPVLVIDQHANSVPLDSLGVWRLSKRWVALRSPYDLQWATGTLSEILTMAGVGLGEFASLTAHLTVEQTALVLLFIVYPEIYRWKSGWPTVTGTGPVQRALWQASGEVGFDGVLLETGYLYGTPAGSDDSDDEDDDGTCEDDTEDSEGERLYEDDYSDDYVERRAMEEAVQEEEWNRRHGQGTSAEWRRIFTMFVNEVVPRIDGRLMTSIIPDWDRVAWQEDQWGI